MLAGVDEADGGCGGGGAEGEELAEGGYCGVGGDGEGDGWGGLLDEGFLRLEWVGGRTVAGK